MKRPSSLSLINLTLLLVLGAGIVHDSRAQSFGDFLKSTINDAARQAVGSNVRQAVSGAVDGAAKGITQPAARPAAGSPAQPAPAEQAAAPVVAQGTVQPGCERRKGTPLPIGERPESFQPATLWPENTDCPVYAVSDLKFDKARAAKTAFREASKVRCNDCEGGYSFDAWGGRSLVKSGDYAKEFPKLLVALAPGQSLGWKGSRFDVRITAIGAHPIGAMPCRQFRYTLTEKGQPVAEYDGMVCEYTRPYIANPSWNELV